MYTQEDIFTSYLQETFQTIDQLSARIEGRGIQTNLPKPKPGHIFKADGSQIAVPEVF